jgi:regulator of RNase E activity RraA
MGGRLPVKRSTSTVVNCPVQPWARLDVPISCGGVGVSSGDLIFGDVDGVVVIPQAIAGPVIDAAIAKVKHENVTRDELNRGLLLGEVYRKYGVL